MTNFRNTLAAIGFAALFLTLAGLGAPSAEAGNRLANAQRAKNAKSPVHQARTAKRATQSASHRKARGANLRAGTKLKTRAAQKKVKTLRAAQLRPTAKMASPKAKKPARRNRLFKNRKKIREFQKGYGGERKKVLANQGADSHIAKVMRHSEVNGEYHIVSDLHWGHGKNKDGKWDAREDFRKGQTFGKFVNQISKSNRGVSLVVGGDWLELMEHVNANASNKEVKKAITKIVEGHKTETKALAKGIVKNGMRLIYLAGNHDVHLVDAKIRSHLVSELARVGGVRKGDMARFKSRVAYSGHGAVLGRYGEGMVVHGHAQDSANNWRSVVNPYNAKRQLQGNLGWSIVSRVYRAVEARTPDIDNVGKSSTKSVALKVLTSPRYFVSAVKVIWELLGGTKHYGRSGNMSERLDDRVAMRAWESRTGFAQKMNNPIPGAKSAKGDNYARVIEDIYQGAPRPMHERMKTPSRLINFIASIATAWKTKREVKQAEPNMLHRMTSELPNVRYVVWGHNHKEAVVKGSFAKGELGHYNTGTWTKHDSQWRLNVVSGHTGADGRLTMDGVFRTDKKTGKPNLPNHYSAENARPVPGWNN